MCLKKAPTLASFSFDKHRLILTIFDKPHQNTIKNVMPIQLSLSLHFYLLYYVPAPNRRGIKRWFCLTFVCLTSVWRVHQAQVENRTTKIGAEVAHVTCNSDTTFKVKRSKVKVSKPLRSLPCWHVRRLQRWAWERVDRVKLLLRCRLLGGASAPTGGRGAGHIVEAARLQLVCF